MNIEKIINEIDGKIMKLKEATNLTGLTLEHHDDVRFYGFLHRNKKCIHCGNKKKLIDILKRKEMLFRKF